MLDSSEQKIDRLIGACSSQAKCGAQLIDALACRRSVPPLRLTEPGPSPDQTEKLLTVALRVPDHGVLEPWRLVLVKGAARKELGGRLAVAYLKANTRQEQAASDLAIRKIKTLLSAPLIVIVVSRVNPSARTPEWEQILSAGAVCMNLLMASSALGYGSTWLTGWTAYDPAALEIVGVQSNERIAGIVPIGTATECQQERVRPALQKLVTMWTAP